MPTLITNGISIGVEIFYQTEYSKPLESKYIFAYRITIENLSGQTVQLKRRHWWIFDSIGTTREVEGEGVVGQQPVLASGESYQYVSWSNIATDLGKMYGFYTMQNLSDGSLFEVHIPDFILIAPFRLN